MMQFKNLEKLKRTRQIVGVLTKYGVEYLFDRRRKGISSTRNTGKNILSTPEKFCRALEELGPTFIKFGQILSTRPDFLPPEFIKELEKLRDNTPPFDFSLVRQIIEEELGKPSQEVFRYFDPVPVAAASLSQVHKAALPDGDQVAVKIRRPGIRQIIEADLAILEDLAQFAENRLHNGWMYRPRLMVEEYRKAVRKELDFTREAQNYEKFRINFSDVEYIRVPKVYWELTTSAVLTMEFIDGIKINETVQEKYRNLYDTHKIALRGAEADRKSTRLNSSH
jgi:ubiquinone biosynthesis protein